MVSKKCCTKSRGSRGFWLVALCCSASPCWSPCVNCRSFSLCSVTNTCSMNKHNKHGLHSSATNRLVWIVCNEATGSRLRLPVYIASYLEFLNRRHWCCVAPRHFQDIVVNTYLLEWIWGSDSGGCEALPLLRYITPCSPPTFRQIECWQVLLAARFVLVSCLGVRPWRWK